MKGSGGGWGSNKRVHFQEPYSKMPKSSGSWKLAVPSWEREFCESVGVSWDQICDNNNDLEGFEPILRWDDSASLEAFQMAKQRYWAMRNGVPCDIPLPGPDLYISEIDWDSQNQQVYDFPERNYSSSEEEYRRPYFKRGRRGRQGRGRNMPRYESRDYRKSSDGNVQCSEKMTYPARWSDTNNNTPQDAQVTGTMEWHNNKQNFTEMSKDFAQNSGDFAISPSGWEDQHNSGWDVKQTDHSGWESHENNNMFSTGWDQKVASGWGNQTEPTRNSTVTTKTGWTDSGDVVSTSIGWGDQNQNGWNVGASGSAWTPYEEEKYTAQGWGSMKDSGWDAKLVDRTGWNNSKSVSEWDSAKVSAPCYVTQDQVIATGWGDQFPEPMHPYYQNQAFMSAQWNSMPHPAQQWQNQSAAWNARPADNEYQFNGNWGGPSRNSFHQQGSQTWFQPPAYSQTTWRPIHSNQGYWQPLTQHKQSGYPAQNPHYAVEKDRDFRANNRRNPR